MSELLNVLLATVGGGGGVPSLAWVGGLLAALVSLCTLLGFVVAWAMGYGELKRACKSLRADLNELKANRALDLAATATVTAQLRSEFADELEELDERVNSHRAAVDAAIGKAVERADIRHEELSRQLQAFATESRESLHKLQLDFVKAIGELGMELKRFADAVETGKVKS